MSVPHDGRAPFRNQRWVECETTLDPYSVGQVDDSVRYDTFRTVLKVNQPDGNISSRGIVVIGPHSKICTNDFPAWVLYDTADGTPAAGEAWGPQSGTNKLKKGEQGFIICGDPVDGMVRVIRQPSTISLVELCLTVNHPGRGVVFTCNPGYWSSASNSWVYTCYTSVSAIDWRYGVPYPEAGSRGLFIPRASDYYGTIYECVSMDCSSPGPCCP